MSPWFHPRGQKKEASKPAPSSGDEQVLRQLREAGSDLSRPHPINHYLYLRTEEAARRAAQTLQGDGFVVQVRPGADNVNWLALASHTVVPSPGTVADTTARMERLAATLGGEYDGWEAAVVK